MRIKLLIAYNGSSFEGSQVQLHTDNTIMGQIYKVFESLNIKTKLHASGRTDAGVHAFKQVMHCEIPDFWSDTVKLKEHLTHKLPSSILIRQLRPCKDDFHSRYSASRRAYRYVLSPKCSNPFEEAFISFLNRPINIELLKEGIKVFEGEHDFSSFKKSGSQTKTNLRTIYKTRVYRYKDKTVLYFEANGFLRSQIRLMVAFLLRINTEELSIEELKQQLNNTKIFNTRPASANGLYLSNIIY
ncbi:MAG: tRNA pseudouridine(38-40) synthase TruA [Arcobacter sp.]|nr:MAG: tRNA pseudouridine(38-40) synthase TruA [Arcobacter sp.]